jgi:hypothetical protein
VKFCVVVNRILRDHPGRALNASGHALAGLVAKSVDSTGVPLGAFEFITYPDGSGIDHDHVSAHGLTVLSANTNQMRTLREALREEPDVLAVDFCDAMIEGSTSEQLHRIARTPNEELVPLAIAAIGPDEPLGALTRRFSLWR